MKRNSFIIILSICSLFQVFAKDSKQQPEWVLNYESAFPNSKYIAQKGTGKSADEAKNDALANISFYFETNVSAVRETNFKSYELSNGKKTTQEIQQNVKRQTSVDTSTSLNAVEFTEAWRNKKDKTWHCVAFIERETLWNQYEPTLRVAKDNFRGFLNKANEAEEPFEKIKLLGMAQTQGEDFLDKISYAQFLSEKLTSEKYNQDILSLASLNSLQQKEKNRMPLYLVVQNDAGNAVYSTINQILGEEGFSVVRNRNSAVYVVNTKLNFDNYKEDGLIVYSPSVQIEFVGKNCTVYVYSKDCAKVKVYTENAGIKKCIQKINSELQENFPNDFNSVLNGKK